MTVNELLSVAIVDHLRIIIREDGYGLWLYAWKIGEDVQVGKYDNFRDKDGKLVGAGKFYKPDKPIEVCRVDGQCRMLIIPKSLKHIPKEVQSLQVASFHHSYVDSGDKRGMEIWCYPSGWTPPAPQPMQTKDEQQISLF